MSKISREQVQEWFAAPETVSYYTKAVDEIGLWNSERAFFTKYLPKQGRILDLGCGAGRTTFGLHRLGYTDLVGVDISPGMVEAAQGHARRLGLSIPFVVGDACSLPFDENEFDGALFSFNGLMQIPRRENRVKAFSEIWRVLKPGAFFVFTTHDRESQPEFFPYWEQETALWEAGEQDPRLHEFGDRLVKEGNRVIFIHIPTRAEVLSCLEEAGLKYVEDAWRPDISEDNPQVVRYFSGSCRFWAVQK